VLVVQGVRGGISSGLSWFGQVTGNDSSDSIDRSRLAPTKMRQKRTLFLDTMQFMPQVQKSQTRPEPIGQMLLSQSHGIHSTWCFQASICQLCDVQCCLNTSASKLCRFHALHTLLFITLSVFKD